MTSVRAASSAPPALVFLPMVAAWLGRASLVVGLVREASRRLGDGGGLKGKWRLNFDGHEVDGDGFL
jgi:hypothetical protein